MSILTWFKDKIDHEAIHYKIVSLDPSHVRLKDGSVADSKALEADVHYFRLFLSEMYLKNDTKWFKTWYPVVHSAITLNFGNHKETLVNVAGGSRLAGVEQNLDRVVSVNYAMTPLLPFKGGTVALDAGTSPGSAPCRGRWSSSPAPARSSSGPRS